MTSARPVRGRRPRRGAAPAIAAVVSMVALAVVTVTVALAAAASAQTATTVTNVVPISQQEPDPLNAGGVVFLFVSAVLFGGALLLYLRHRPRVRS
jgi:glycerol-3-phosphate acyltransferase PlsY